MPPQAKKDDTAVVVDDFETIDLQKTNKNDDNDAMLGPEHQVQKATCFSDERGNLKFVNAVVKRPMTMFFLILGLAFLLTFLLGAIVFREGNPFSNPENQFDMDDVRSIQYDSLRLARDQVEGQREEAALKEEEEASGVVVVSNSTDSSGNTALSYQSENGDVMYWVFEGQQESGVFGTVESIAAMKEALDLFLLHQNYTDYCQLDTSTKDEEAGEDDDDVKKCALPLTALNMYYASTWDSTLIQETYDSFFDMPGIDKVGLFNMVAICQRQPSTCPQVLSAVNCTGLDETCEALPQAFVEWVSNMDTTLTTITQGWDGQSPTVVGNITEATQFASLILQLPLYKYRIDLAYDKEFAPDNLVSMFSRAIILFGKPLQVADETRANAETDQERDDADETVLKKYIVDNFLKDMNNLATDETHEEINSYYFMGALIFDVLLEIVRTDGMLAIISLTFVFLWLRLNVSSWFLAYVGILEIFFSIPVGWFLFTVVFQIKYFAFLNSLSLFIVAAIGADDIFIFMDAYKQSARIRSWPDLETRMSWVYRRTGTAMAITSATTCTAFLCTLITPLVQIQSFGIFAALVIFMDYVLVMTLFCTSVVIYHNKYETRGCCGGGCWKKNLEVNPTDQARLELEANPSTEMKGDRVSEFFKNSVAPFILKPTNRLVLFVVFTSWIAVAVWQTTLIEPTRESEQFLNEDHPLQKSFTILGNEFPTADEDLGLPVHYAWGLGEVDRTGVALLLEPNNFGTPTFVPNVSWNSDCQSGLLSVCEEFQASPQYTELIKRKNALGTVKCVWEELLPFYRNRTENLYEPDDVTGYCNYVTSKEWKTITTTDSSTTGTTTTTSSFTIPEDELDEVIAAFLDPDVGLRSCIETSDSVVGRYQNELGFDGTTLQYVSISVESSVLDPFSRKPELVARAEYDQFVSIQDELSSRNLCHTAAADGSSVAPPVIMTDLNEIFIFMNNQSIYVATAIQSSLLGVAIAFVVLLLATRKLHLALFASLSIACVLVSVTGTMVLIGWTLGSIESILIGIIAGFSVDYVVHLAHAYETASGNTDERIVQTFSVMGISVLNGMITSIAASIPLFFCQLQFFHKFGIFICLTIAFSWIFANFLFMSVLAQLKIPIKEKKKTTNTNTEEVEQQQINNNKSAADDDEEEEPITTTSDVVYKEPTTTTASAAVIGNDDSSSDGECEC